MNYLKASNRLRQWYQGLPQCVFQRLCPVGYASKFSIAHFFHCGFIKLTRRKLKRILLPGQIERLLMCTTNFWRVGFTHCFSKHRVTNIILGDTKKAQIWRCQTLEILDPSIGDGEAEILARKNAKALRLEVARKFAEDFLGGPAGALLARTNSKENLSRRGDELEDIFLQALDISARVWKQPIVLKCKQFKDFEDEKFVSDSEIMDAHPLHQLGFSEDGEEEDETRLDGHRILMVVSPAILAIGGSDGDDYQNYRVWAKAVVWLEE
jgi:hypothetical protein